MRATNIIWDTEDNGKIIPQEDLGLPSEVDLDIEIGEDTDICDEIANYLSNEYGYCVISFDYE